MRIYSVFKCLILCALVLSCKPQVPDKYLQPGEFEDILYDYHLADAMAQNEENSSEDEYNTMLYRQAVLNKYGITQAEFDSSLVYYTRHSDRLHQVYENLVKRFEDDAMSLGASANDIRRFGDMRSERDTSNLWVGEPATMLTVFPPYNVMSFEIMADSTYQAGDRIIFSFNCDFIYNEGIKDGRAVLAVQFKNDSVASSMVRMSSNMNYVLTVTDSDKKGIKAIRGFVYLEKSVNYGSSMTNNDLCLMFIDNIRMVRMRGMSSLGSGVNGNTSAPMSNDTARRIVGANPVGQGSGQIGQSQHKPSSNSKPLKLSDVRPLPPHR